MIIIYKYSEYLINKIEEALKFKVNNNGIYIKIDMLNNIVIDTFYINGKILIPINSTNKNYRKFIKFNPKKFYSHLDYLIDALNEFSMAKYKVSYAKDTSYKRKYFGNIEVIIDSMGNTELAFQTKYSYKNPKEAILKAILTYLTDFDEDKDR